MNLLLLHICPAARLAQTSASPSPLQSHPPTSPNTRQPELLFKNTVTPQASPHQLHTLYNALIALSKVQGQQDLSLGGPSLPFSVHPIFNSPKTCPVWNPYQVEKEKRAFWEVGTAQNYEGVCTFREVGMDQKSQGLGSRGSLCPNSMTYTLYSSRAGPLTPWGLCLYHSLSLECQIQNAYPPLSLARPPKSSVLSFGQFCSGQGRIHWLCSHSAVS